MGGGNAGKIHKLSQNCALLSERIKGTEVAIGSAGQPLNSGTLLLFCLHQDTAGTRPKRSGLFWPFRDGCNYSMYGGGYNLYNYALRIMCKGKK